MRRARDGDAEPIRPETFAAHFGLSGTVVYPVEYAILRAMDRAYCAELASELKDYQARRAAEQEATANAKPKKGWFRR